MACCYIWYDPFPYATWLIDLCDMTPSHMRPLPICNSLLCLTWPLPTGNMAHSYVWHDSLPHATWLIFVCDVTPFMWTGRTWGHAARLQGAIQGSFICVTWLFPICERHDSFLRVTWLHPCVQRGLKGTLCNLKELHEAHPHVWHDAFLHVTLLISVCDETPSIFAKRPSGRAAQYICKEALRARCAISRSYTRLIHMCDMTHSYTRAT